MKMAMKYIWNDYGAIFIFLLIGIGLSVVILALSYALANQAADNEKLSAYECGFSPFEDARNKFDVKFYLVGILFIIFDLEVTFLFPWITNFATNSIISFWSMILFLVILTYGFAYEWLKGALEWQ